VLDRSSAVRLRLDGPLVVATLGGTGVGKSALVNALAGDEVAPVGRTRPTTCLPSVICRPDLALAMLGIDPESVQVVRRDLPALRDLVLIDCPDPDTSEAPEEQASNLSRLRAVLPLCDVILVVATQQKYRSARVSDELEWAASGARLVFVQTHADAETDIREDWRRVLSEWCEAGRIFRVDSPAALADARAGREPRGEFAALAELLTAQLAGAVAARLRRANLIDLVDDALSACCRRLDEALPKIRTLERAIQEYRSRMAAESAIRLRGELLDARRSWESRILARVASHWGFSPFSVLLRVYQGLGGLVAGAILLRARTPAQMVLWGAVEGARGWRRVRRDRKAEQAAVDAAASWWDPATLRAAALAIDGYVSDADLRLPQPAVRTVAAEAAGCGAHFAAGVSGAIDAMIDRAARRHTGWFVRGRYELGLLAMLAAILYRPARNFFYDTWLAGATAPLWGLDQYLVSAFWLALWCGALVWVFTGRLRRGLSAELAAASETWNRPDAVAELFAPAEEAARSAGAFTAQLAGSRRRVAELKRALPADDIPAGRKRERPA
jgi:hypothetical protein